MSRRRAIVTRIAVMAVLLSVLDGAAAGAPSLSGIRIDNPAPAADARFGFTVAGLDDLDGDGTADIAVGTLRAGRVYLISGSDFSVLHEIVDPDNLTGTQCAPTVAEPSPCHFGVAVGAAGDVDKDGTGDVAVGSPGLFGAIPLPCGVIDPNEPCPQFGRAFVFSGATGALLLRLQRAGGSQGTAVVGLGSVNADTVPDIAVVSSGVSTKGLVAVFSGVDGSLLWSTAPPDTSGDIQGLTRVEAGLAAIADVNGDGRKDLAVGAPCYAPDGGFCVGRVYVLSGVNGLVLRIHENPTPLDGDAFGEAVAAVGVQDVCCVGDFAVLESGGSASSGSFVHLFSGATGAPIGAPIASPADERNPPGTSQASMAIAAVDDKDGDGFRDFWLGAGKTGAAYLMNKHGQVLLMAGDSASGSGFGQAASPVAALTSGGGLDAVVGAPTRSVGSVPAAGAVFLLRPEADLEVAKSASPATVVPGGTLTYTATVDNGGPSPAVAVELTDPIAPSLGFVAGSLADDPACTFNAALHRVECAVGTLSAGGTFSVDFQVRVPDDAAVPSSIANAAAATSVTLDPDPADNSASLSSAVACDIVGTPGNDVLRGSAGSESICGLGGNDHLIGLGSGDELVGGAGGDILHGDQGDDTLRGGSGDDGLFGGPGVDQLDGGDGTDVCKPQGDGGSVTACELG